MKLIVNNPNTNATLSNGPGPEWSNLMVLGLDPAISPFIYMKGLLANYELQILYLSGHRSGFIVCSSQPTKVLESSI